MLPILLDDQGSKAQRLQQAIDTMHSTWDPKFDDLAREMAYELASDVQKHVNLNFIRRNFTIPRNKAYEETLQAIVSEHLNLIKSIPMDIIDKYRYVLSGSIGNFNLKSVRNEILRISAVGVNRANLIARDQVAKSMERYQMAIASDLGFEYYEWLTAKDGRVSSEHKPLDRKYYRYDKPTAIIDKKGTIGIPGQRVNCRCTAAPVFVAPGDKMRLVKDSKIGDYYEA